MMKRTSWKRAGLILMIGLASTFQTVRAADYPYKIGSGSADITGPAVGLAMWGFVHEGQVTEGIHTRLRARAFVIVDAESGKRLAFVSADIGSMTNAMAREVIDQLHTRFPGVYTIDNTIISATHTHSGPGGYWHYGVDSPIADRSMGNTSTVSYRASWMPSPPPTKAWCRDVSSSGRERWKAAVRIGLP